VQRDRLWPAANIEAALWNLLYSGEGRPEGGFTAAHFMPGAKIQTQEDKLREFAERVLAGDTFQDD
jgi:hypothetical protein